MIVIKKTEKFEKWIRSLKDKAAIARINIKIRRLQLGNFGDVKSVGGGISELRIDYGPRYRVYFCKIQNTVVLLINGGDKSSQNEDIDRAKSIKSNLENQ